MQGTPTPPASPAPADPLKRHRLDLAAVEGGKWVDIRGDRWLVASYTAKAVALARSEALVELGLPPNGDVPPHHSEKVGSIVFARAIVRGCRLQDAPETVYSHELGERIFRDPELARLRDELQAAALGDYTQDEVAKAAVLGNC